MGGSFSARVPRSSAAVRVVVVHNIKEEEGERQYEVQEAKDMKRRKVNEMEKSKRGPPNMRMKHGDDETNKAQT